jgi:hypothetical protein
MPPLRCCFRCLYCLFDAAPLRHCLSAAVMPFSLPLMLSHAAAAADTPLLPFFAAAFRAFDYC